ncbi:MAG: flagellar basal-body rod protein FlgF [Alphaproteobacteria bacterium]|nr:flagellar basal-body rod protein FlgF [Alphaproteobacteria bacterium]
MENSLYVGLSKQVVLRENMNIIANNVANVNTPGFRGQNMVFTEYIEDPRYMKEDISMVLDYGQYQMTDPGPVKNTGNPLDVALIGEGFMGIQTNDGIQYTRAGNLSMNVEGTLVNALGLPVASEGGGSITIPQGATDISIDRTGVVSTEEGVIGKLMIKEFENEQELNPAGNGLYVTDAAPLEPTKTTVVQGKLEGSNVQAVIEMTRMIDVSREYQAVQNMMNSENERLRSAIRKLSERA